MKKGMSFSTLSKFALGAAFIVFLLNWAINNFSTEDGIPAQINKSVGVIENLVNQAEIRECDQATLDKDNVGDNRNLIEQVADSSTNPTVPSNIAIQIAIQESGVKHCDQDDNVIVTDPRNLENASIGIMQIYYPTWQSDCPELDVYDLNDNVECGIRVFQNKYNEVSNHSYYRERVRETCGLSEHRSRYWSYIPNQWEMALRAYNGYGCTVGADVCYVEHVMRRNCPVRN